VLRLVVFNLLLFGCLFYAWLRGGGPEKAAATILAVGSLVTPVFGSDFAVRFSSVEVGVLVVDIVVLAGLLLVALCAERLWPLWVVALHIVGMAAHGVRMVDPTIMRWAYGFAIAFWSYPMLLLVIVGTWRHQQRLARFGADKSWSSFFGRSAAKRKTGATG
jgi:hypothetical protein